MLELISKISQTSGSTPIIDKNGNIIIGEIHRDSYISQCLAMLESPDLERSTTELIYDTLWLNLRYSHQNGLDKYIHTLGANEINISGFKNIENYVACNPSIVNFGNDYLINIRYVNYKQRYALDYMVTTGDGIVHTKNFLFWVNSAFEIKGEVEIIESDRRVRYFSNVQDLEDVRLFWDATGFLSGSCTICDDTPHSTRRIGSFQTTLQQLGTFPTAPLIVDIQASRITFR